MLGQLGKRDGGLQGTRRSKAQWNRGWGEEIAPLRVGCRNACSQAKKVRARREGRLRVGRGEAGAGGEGQKNKISGVGAGTEKRSKRMQSGNGEELGGPGFLGGREA